ncbi:hypothetical protein ES703_81730 [subsurface metagenome]
MLVEGDGSNYSYTVAKRLLNNINDAGLSRLFPGDVKSVFFGDTPFGGGTSGSSAKLISDFFILASVNNLLSDDEFVSLPKGSHLLWRWSITRNLKRERGGKDQRGNTEVQPAFRRSCFRCREIK